MDIVQKFFAGWGGHLLSVSVVGDVVFDFKVDCFLLTKSRAISTRTRLDLPISPLKKPIIITPQPPQIIT
jgi:hypothetical protein